MKDVLERVITQNLTSKSDIIDEIILELGAETSQLIEVVGQSGTGKSYLFKKLSQVLTNRKIAHIDFIPSYFKFNHLSDILNALCKKMDEDLFHELVSSWKNASNNKYNFFYYLSTMIKERDLVSPNILLIDSADILDHYAIDFIQYFVQYFSKQKFTLLLLQLNRSSLLA